MNNKTNMQTNANIPLFIAARLENKKDFERKIWITLPVTKPCFYEAVGAVCDSWDDFKIGMYRTNIYGFHNNKLMKAPFSLVNFLAARLNKLTVEQALKLIMIMESCYEFSAVSEIIDFTYHSDRYELITGIRTYWQLGEHRKNELDRKTVPPIVIQCINTESFGRETALQENGEFTPLGYLSSKDGFGKTVKERPIPDCWDVKDLNGDDIYGDLYDDDAFYFIIDEDEDCTGVSESDFDCDDGI